MIRIIAAALALSLVAGSAWAQTFGPDSTFQEMMANPKARAILDNNIPLVMTVFDGGSGRPETATLKSVSENEQARSMGGFTDVAYAKILAEFRALSSGPSSVQPPLGADTPFKVLMAHPRARAILQAEVPIIVMAYDAGRIDEAGSLRVASQIESARDQGGLTPEVYAKILADLAKL